MARSNKSNREHYGLVWERGALMVAKGEKTRHQIAVELEISYQLLSGWINDDPEFQAEVESIKAEIKQALIEQGIAAKAVRLEKYNRIVERIESVIDSRSKSCAAGLIAGGESGLIAHDVRLTRSGEPIDIGRFDGALVREFRETLKQAAIEVGDWSEKRELSGPHEGPIQVEILSAITKIYGDGSDSGN